MINFDPSLKYGNVIEGQPAFVESMRSIILEDARKILPKGTKFSVNIYIDKYAAAVAWRYPETGQGRKDLKNETVLA